MRLLLRAESCALLLALAACSSKVDSTNPYDPGTPVGQKAKARVHGRILAPTLAPPIAVQVTLSTNNVPFGQQVTAADGSFVFSDLPPGAYALQASPQGFVPLLLPLTLQPGDDIDLKDVALTVVTGPSLGTLSGKATLGTTATDNSGIFVETVVAAGAAFSTQTNQSGDWSLSVAPGSYTLRFSHKNFKPTTTTQPVVVAQGAAAQVPPVALAYDPATVSGAVDGELAAGGTAPLTDATVTLDSTGVTGVSGGAGPAAGTFALTGIPAGSYVLRAIKAGYLADTQPVLELAGHEVRALATHLVLKLARGGIAGSVQLAGSADASGVTVQLSGGGSGSAITGPDGKYSFNGLLTGVYTVTASRPGYQTVVLGAAVTVTVGAVASPGAGTLQPNPATLLGHVDAENAAGGTDPLQNAAISLDGVPGATTLSNVGGDFALPVPVGSYVVRVHLAGYQDDTQPALNLSGGEQRTLPNPFRLSLLRGSIAGTVLLSGRADASGIAVTFRNASFSFTTLTGASGAFTSGSIPVGSYTVDATRAPDWQPISVAAVAVARNAVAALPGSPVTLQPLATATLGGTALLELQANASGTTVSLTGTDFRGVAVNATGTTSNAGVFSVGSLLAGGYQIAFSQGGFDSPPPVGVSVVTGQAANVGTLTLLASRGSDYHGPVSGRLAKVSNTSKITCWHSNRRC